MVSPYLNRPLRSLEEVMKARAMTAANPDRCQIPPASETPRAAVSGTGMLAAGRPISVATRPESPRPESPRAEPPAHRKAA